MRVGIRDTLLNGDPQVSTSRTPSLLTQAGALMNFRVVQAAYYARRYDVAVQSARTAIDLAPDFKSPYAYMASALLATGHMEEAWTKMLFAGRHHACQSSGSGPKRTRFAAVNIFSVWVTSTLIHFGYAPHFFPATA
jgi:hypothetical protein